MLCGALKSTQLAGYSNALISNDMRYALFVFNLDALVIDHQAVNHKKIINLPIRLQTPIFLSTELHIDMLKIIT